MIHINEVLNLDNIPSLDIHGEIADIARVLINEFIEDNKKLRNNLFCIIHGVGSGILRKTTQEILKKRKDVIDFKTFYYNHGATLVEILIK